MVAERVESDAGGAQRVAIPEQRQRGKERDTIVVTQSGTGLFGGMDGRCRRAYADIGSTHTNHTF